MKKHLMILLTLSTLLAYRPGHAQARSEGPGESSPTMVASVRTKATSTRTAPELAGTKPVGTAIRKEAKTTTAVAQKPISLFWSRIMGICSELHTASKKKS